MHSVLSVDYSVAMKANKADLNLYTWKDVQYILHKDSRWQSSLGNMTLFLDHYKTEVWQEMYQYVKSSHPI